MVKIALLILALAALPALAEDIPTNAVPEQDGAPVTNMVDHIYTAEIHVPTIQETPIHSLDVRREDMPATDIQQTNELRAANTLTNQ